MFALKHHRHFVMIQIHFMGAAAYSNIAERLERAVD